MVEQLEKFISLFEQSALILAIISILFLVTGLIVLYFRRKYTLMLQREKSRNRSSETLLRSRSAVLEEILNQLHKPVAYKNSRGEFEWVNREMAVLWGLPTGRIIKSRPEDLFPDWIDEIRSIETALRSGNQPVVREKKIVVPGGESRSYEITYKQIPEPGEGGAGLLISYKDISTYRDQLDVLNDLYLSVREDLQQRSDYYADFLRSGLQPLHSIMEESEGILQGRMPDSEVRERVERIVTSGQSMSNYIRNLSFLALPDRISSLYEEGVSRETLSLEDWQNHLMKRVAALRGNRDFPVFLLLQGDIPETLYTRFSLLNELLDRLIENADAHTTGGYYLIIKVHRVEAGFFTMNITVRNTGPVIDASRREDIFKPFTRILTEQRGSGLGLTVARSLAEKMGGSLSCDPSCTDGARFLLSLPPVAGSGTVISGSRLEGAVSRDRQTVLLADPDLSCIRKIAGQLARTGCTADLAGTAGEILEFLEKKSYCIVLSDETLLRESGIAKRWSAGEFPGTVQLVSMDSSYENVPSGISTGGLPVIAKPVQWSRLLDFFINDGN